MGDSSIDDTPPILYVYPTVANQVTEENLTNDPDKWWSVTLKTCYVNETGHEVQCYSNSENYIAITSEFATCENTPIIVTKNVDGDELFASESGVTQTAIDILHTDDSVPYVIKIDHSG